MIEIDGNDGTGKTTVVNILREQGFEVLDRGALTPLTDVMESELRQHATPNFTVLLDCSVKQSRLRLEMAGKDLEEKYHTLEDLRYYRHKFLSLAAYYGFPVIDTENKTVDEVVTLCKNLIRRYQHQITYRELCKLTQAKVSGSFVTGMGVQVLATHEGLTQSAHSVFSGMGLRGETFNFGSLSEFAARLTYLSFSQSDIHAILQEHGHLSCYGINVPAILVVGLSTETLLEMVSHHEFNVARLTTSMTRAMNYPLFSLTGDSSPEERESIRAVSQLSQNLREKHKGNVEFQNQLYSGFTASAMLMSGSPKDWHKLFLGRIKPRGIERQTVELCCLMRKALAEHYPEVIQSEEYYLEANNAEKYKA